MSKLLIIDDESGHGSTMYGLFSQYGFESERRESNLGAIKACYDVFVVIDVHRKGGNVGNLKRAISAAKKCDGRVLLISAYGQLDSAYREISFEEVNFFDKAGNPRDLKRMLGIV